MASPLIRPSLNGRSAVSAFSPQAGRGTALRKQRRVRGSVARTKRYFVTTSFPFINAACPGNEQKKL
jgi:hypothetical protein